MIRLLIEEYNMRVVWDLQPYLNLNNHRKSPVAAPDEWQILQDSKSGAKYYFKASTGESKWV